MAPSGIKHFWYELRDEEGELRPFTSVNVYESVIDDVHQPYPAANEINLYDETDTTVLTQPISTTSAGILEFFIRDDMWPSGGYAWDDRIRIQWQHEGSDKFADRVMLWGEFYKVLDGRFADTNTDINKATSNELVCEINSHMISTLGEDLPSSSSSISSSLSSSSSISSSSSSISSISSSSSSSSISSSSSSASATSTIPAITSGDDDGGWYSSGFQFYTNYPPNSTFQLIGNTNATGRSFWRFNNIQVPKDATILSAKITFKARANDTGSIPQKIFLEQSGNPPAPSSTPDLGSRTISGGGDVDWDPVAFVEDSFYDTPDMSAIIENITDRSDWAIGNSMLIIMIPQIGTFFRDRVVRSFPTYATELIIT